MKLRRRHLKAVEYGLSEFAKIFIIICVAGLVVSLIIVYISSSVAWKQRIGDAVSVLAFGLIGGVLVDALFILLIFGIRRGWRKIKEKLPE